jgi:transaldolase
MLDIRIKLYADTAEWSAIDRYADDSRIAGFTTNPSLFAKAGVDALGYADLARRILERVAPKPVSLEVLSSDMEEMIVQARKIRAWGTNAVVKIPVVTTKGEFTAPVIETLTGEGIPINITAVMTVAQAESIARALPTLSTRGPGIIVSFFAGRVADTGRDPVMIARAICDELPGIPVLWASTRELLNVYHAQNAGCSIITLSPELIDKLPILHKDLSELTLQTVRQFHRDGERYVI